MVLHYAQEVFEGLKAYRGPDGGVQLFRPMENVRRINSSCERMCIPPLPEEDALAAIEQLVRLEAGWVPSKPGTSLYIRPFIIATTPSLGVHAAHDYLFCIITCPVGAYYAEGINPVKIYVENEDVRAVKGGTGYTKCGGNYAASIRAGERADAFLARSVPDLTRSAAQRLLEEGAVTVNGTAVKKNYKTSPGDQVTFTLPDPEPIDVQPQNIPLDVVFEDDDVIVVNKPVGLVVHPAPGHPDGTLVNALLYHCGSSLSGINGAIRPGIVHRIDRDTSGLIIAAKNDRAHLALAAQLQDHSLARVYEAVTVGGLKEDSGTVNAPIARHPVDRKRMAVDWKNGRPAVTHWSVLARYALGTHVECRLETGRTHQIRVHMASIGHPLLGDTVYGSKKPWPGLAGQCLHARRLKFVHPTTGKLVELECPLPDWFQHVLRQIDR